MLKHKTFVLLIVFAATAVVLYFSHPVVAALVGDTSQVTLSLSPSSGNFNANDSFTVSLYLNTNGKNIDVVAAYLKYDKTHFQAVSIDTTNSIFSFEAEKIIDSSSGIIKITRGIPTPGVNTSNGLIAKINFIALSNVTPATDNLTFDFTPGSPLATNAFNGGNPLLSGVYNAKYTVGTAGPIYYANGSLLKASNSDMVYLIDNSQKRWIPSGDIFKANGYSWSSVVTVDPSVLGQYADGPDVTMATTGQPGIPDGALIRANGGIDVYIVKYMGTKMFKRLILSPSVFNSYQHLKWSNVMDVDQSVLDSFTTSNLVRAVNDPKVYELYPAGDTGQKRWIETADVFTRLGLDWDSVYEINQVDRDSYVTGDPLE